MANLYREKLVTTLFVYIRQQTALLSGLTRTHEDSCLSNLETTYYHIIRPFLDPSSTFKFLPLQRVHFFDINRQLNVQSTSDCSQFMGTYSHPCLPRCAYQSISASAHTARTITSLGTLGWLGLPPRIQALCLLVVRPWLAHRMFVVILES